MTDNNAETTPPEAKPQAPPPPAARPPTIVAPPPPWWAYPPRRSFAGRVFKAFIAMVFVVSIVLNCYLVAYIFVQWETPMATATLREGKESQTVAVYTVAGMIGGKAVSRFAEFYNQVFNDPNVKAVVLRVESGGGGVSASDQIYWMVKKLKDKGKKIVVSMGGVAASGGYYISAPAHEIVAEPTTVTGSIGVIAVWPVIKGTLDKYGVEMVVMKSRHAEEWKDEGSFLDKPSPKHRKHIQDSLDKIQARFEQVVKEGRAGKLKPSEPKQAAEDAPQPAPEPAPEFEAFNGKVYMADEARQLGLIDREGYADDAIERAISLAGLTNPRVLEYERRKGLVEKLIDGLSRPGLTVGTDLLDELQKPRFLLVWKVD